jgi:hypothetical protein
MTTSQTYQTDDGQLVQAHDQAISEDNLIETEASLAAPETDLAELDADLAVADADLMAPDADLMAPDADLMASESDLAEPDADQAGHEDPTSHPAGAVALADHESATSIASDYPGVAPDGADQPEMAASSPGSPSLVSEAITVPESATDSHLAGSTASAGGPWNEVQAMFVDDPRASIEQAADLVDNRVEALIHAYRERQRSMQSAWQADDAGTEELRVALQHYRTFWNSLDDLPAQA